MKNKIIGTGKVVNVDEGTISLKYDKDIVKWFKQFSEDTHEIIYLNDGDIIRQMSKTLGVTVENSFNDYWDEHYTHYMDFFVDTEFAEVTDKAIKQALKNTVFTIKLKAEKF